MCVWDDHACDENTWGGMVAHAREYGARLVLSKEIKEGMKAPILYLEIQHGDETKRYPLPMNCTPDRPCGLFHMNNVTARLGIPIPDWAMIL